MSLAASFIDADTLVVAGDYVANFVINRRARAYCGAVDGYKYPAVASATYSAPNTTVNFTAASDDLTSNLTTVEWSVVSSGSTGNLALHNHSDEDAGGLLTAIPSIVMADGGTIGQAAGPLITFDDTLNRLKITGCNVTIGPNELNTILYLSGNGTTGANTLGFRWAADSSGYGPGLSLHKARGTMASPTIVVSSDDVGAIVFGAYDGANWLNTAMIMSEVDGTPGTNDMPGRLGFYTTLDGASSPSVRMMITNDGSVGMGIASSLLGRCHIAQASSAATVPVLVLDQADLSEEFIKFITTIGTGNPIEAVGAKSLTTTHFIRVEIPGPAYVYIPAGTIA